MRPMVTMNYRENATLNCEDIFYSVNTGRSAVDIQRISIVHYASNNSVRLRIKAHIDPYYDDQSSLRVEMYYFAHGWKEIFSDTPKKSSYEICGIRMSSQKDDMKELFDHDCNKLFSMIIDIISG